MPLRRPISIQIGGDDWRFLESLAAALDLEPTDAVTAFWKIAEEEHAP